MVIQPIRCMPWVSSIWIYETKVDALEGAEVWLKANDLDDMVTPGRLVQTLIPNTIHTADIGDRCFVVITLGSLTIAALREQQAVVREGITGQLQVLENKKQALLAKNRWAGELVDEK
jgi:hypothetical protein